MSACTFNKITETLLECSRCGAIVRLARNSDGSVILPDFDKLPPCGWQSEILNVGGHVWIESYRADGNRHWTCKICGDYVALKGSVNNKEAITILSRRPQCKKGTTEVQGSKTPNIINRAVRYSKALTRWLASGRPTRSAKEINKILQICQACSNYDHDKKICKICGCRLSRDPRAWQNKIAMATEHCPICKWGCKLSEEELKKFVGCAYVIENDYRPNLASKLIDSLHGSRWPFVIPTVYKLTDADRSKAIRRVSLNNRLLGRQMTHLQALHDGFSSGVDSVLIMEDCAYIADNFTEQVSEFLASVPKDWECIVLGCEHASPPQATGILGVVRARSIYRVYAYIARPSYMKALQEALSEGAIVDWAVDDCYQRGTIYAPEDCLVALSPECSDGRHWVIVDCNTLSKVFVADIQDTLPCYDGKIVRVVARNEPVCGVVMLSESYDIILDSADLISEFRACDECSA